MNKIVVVSSFYVFTLPMTEAWKFPRGPWRQHAATVRRPHQPAAPWRSAAQLLLWFFSLWSWPNSTTCCSGCSCSGTRGSGRRVCCAGSRRVNLIPHISPPSVSKVIQQVFFFLTDVCFHTHLMTRYQPQVEPDTQHWILFTTFYYTLRIIYCNFPLNSNV